jgi:hypothetical protein
LLSPGRDMEQAHAAAWALPFTLTSLGLLMLA